MNGYLARFADGGHDPVSSSQRRAGDVRPGAQLGVGERHARGENPDPYLARTWPGVFLLHDSQDLGPAEVIDDDTLHGPHLSGFGGGTLRP